MSGMKFAVLAIVACSWAYMAEAAKYSIPVLTVRSDGRRDVPESGRMNLCPFSYVSTSNDTPVKVSIVEDMPSGAGNSLRASLWLAVTTASMTLNRDLAGVTVEFETSGYVDGPSAGGVFCLAVMSAAEGRTFPNDFAMTGTIMADGTIGAVGGVAEKIKAASKAGVKRVCIPASVRLDDDFTDLMDLGKALGLEMHQVATISDAYRILHRLPVCQMHRLNPVETCRLPSTAEGVLKERFLALVRDTPRNESPCNRQIRKAVDEFVAGIFGAAALDMICGLDKCVFDSLFQQPPELKNFPVLQKEFPANGNSLVSLFVGENPSKADYAKALIGLYRSLRNQGGRGADDDLEENPTQENSAQTGKADTNPEKEWFDDKEDSPVAAQFVTLGHCNAAAAFALELECEDIARRIESIKDWESLEPADINEIRRQLLRMQKLQRARGCFNPGTECEERIITLYAALCGSIPYVKPNSSVTQVENMFYRTMAAMDASLMEAGIPVDFSMRKYMYLRSAAEIAHAESTQAVERLRAVFLEVHAVSSACVLLMRAATDRDNNGEGNLTFFGAAVSTARENAMMNISECQRLGIPCVLPIICFQLAESQRDSYSSEDDAESNRREALANYLQASLSAKALVLCFGGCKPELNKKGYCSKSVTYDMEASTMTVRYLGVDGEPILRGAFSGYQFLYEGNDIVCRSWLDLKGRNVRVATTNGCWTISYDASDRRICQTYCNDSWMATPREDGVLFERYGYDADGNQNIWEFFGASSNRVACRDGMAIIKSRFNKRGQEIWRRFYDTSGNPVAHVEGNVGLDAVYDKRGNERRVTFVDDKGNPVMTSNGFARVESKYDAKDHVVERTWYDEQGRLGDAKGIAKCVWEYDDNGNMTSLAFFGRDNRLVRGSENYSIARWTLRSGEVIECRYFGPDGKPTLHKDGNASWRVVFDSSGRNIGRKYYDLNGNEIDLTGANGKTE